MTAINRATLDLMLRTGSGFERALAKCIIEADTPQGYAKATVDLYAEADEANRHILDSMFENDFLARVWRNSEAKRVGYLHDEFIDVFSRFEAVAQRKQTACQHGLTRFCLPCGMALKTQEAPQ